MHNDEVTTRGGLPVDEVADLRSEVTDLTERIHGLFLERSTAVRMRNRAMVRLRRQGASVDELVDLTGMHPDDVTEILHAPWTADHR